MASATTKIPLTDAGIEKLAKVIASNDLESISYEYLTFKYPDVSAIRKGGGTGVAEATRFNREVLKKWRNMCTEHDQVEVRFQYVQISINFWNIFLNSVYIYLTSNYRPFERYLTKQLKSTAISIGMRSTEFWTRL